MTWTHRQAFCSRRGLRERCWCPDEGTERHSDPSWVVAWGDSADNPDCRSKPCKLRHLQEQHDEVRRHRCTFSARGCGDRACELAPLWGPANINSTPRRLPVRTYSRERRMADCVCPKH